MQTMRYINLLDRTSQVKTRKCFVYNNVILFAVPKIFVSKAIGHDAINVRRIQENLGKKIRIIQEADGFHDTQRFIEDVVSPVKFKSLEVKDNELIISSGGTQTKAALLGRNKRRYDELKKIVEDTFNLELRIL
jgi:transcription antitermination factor NusA-like protein